MAKGWHREPRRHGLAAKGIKTAIKDKPVITTTHKIEMMSPYDIKDTYARLEYYEGGETVDAMVKHLEEGGTLPPILIDDNDELIDGRHRRKAYMVAGIKKVPVIRGLDPSAHSISINGRTIKTKTGSIKGQTYAYADDNEKVVNSKPSINYRKGELIEFAFRKYRFVEQKEIPITDLMFGIAELNVVAMQKATPDKLEESRKQIEKLSSDIKQGAKMPPILVEVDKKGKFVTVRDGYHRLMAYEQLGIKRTDAILVKAYE
jgi:uncharacterized ParB-like nuclease family protein